MNVSKIHIEHEIFGGWMMLNILYVKYKRLNWCWWQVWDVGDWFRMLVTYLLPWKNHRHNEKSRQHNDSATNISNRSPSYGHQHNDVNNITVTHIKCDTLSKLQSVTHKRSNFNTVSQFYHCISIIACRTHVTPYDMGYNFLFKRIKPW